MEDKRALIAPKGILFLLGYCEQMDLTKIKHGICFLCWKIWGLQSQHKQISFKNDLTKIKSRGHHVIQDLLMTHRRLI